MLSALLLVGLSFPLLERLPLGTGPARLMLWYGIATLFMGLIFNRVLSPARRWQVPLTLAVAIATGVASGFLHWYLYKIAG